MTEGQYCRGDRQDVPSTLSCTCFWSRPAALRASHVYIPESEGCARASCRVWVPVGVGVGEPALAPANQLQAPGSLPRILKPSQTPSGVPSSGKQPWLPTKPQSWSPSFSLPTRQEEDFFSQGEGPAILVPRDLGARVSMDFTREGDAVAKDGGDLLRVQTCDAWWGCPRNHQHKERHMTRHTGRGAERHSMEHRGFMEFLHYPGQQPLFVRAI